MENKFLKQKLNQLQSDYCELLEKSVDKLSTKDFAYIAEEINLFWYRNRNIVEIILQHFSVQGQDTLLFTGTTNVDIQDNELYPYVILGDSYIIDDAFANISSFTANLPKLKFKSDTNDCLVKTAQDNMNIIKNYPEIYILPVSFLNNRNLEEISKIACDIFLSFFQDEKITNIELLLEKYQTLEDLINAIPNNIQQQLIVSDYDREPDLYNNYLIYKNSDKFPFPKNIPDTVGFYTLINGYIIRALTILEMSFKYNFVPYLRYSLIFQYFALLGYHFKTQQDYSNLILKGICCHLVYKYFDKTSITHCDFNDYLKNLKIYNFKGRLYKDLEENKIELSNISIPYIREKILYYLKDMLNQ